MQDEGEGVDRRTGGITGENFLLSLASRSLRHSVLVDIGRETRIDKVNALN
jgi:hypothetical protein